MAISFNTGTTASANTATSVGVTIPAGVLTNDVMLMMLTVFCETGTQPTISFSGGGATWIAPTPNTGTNPEVATAGSSIWSYGFFYYAIATASDPGATLTISESGSPAGTTWFAVSLASYTGASTSSPIDVLAGNNAQAVASLNGPTISTVQANDWAIQMCGGAVAAGNSLLGPATNREFVTSSAAVDAGLSDSNGTVAAGTNIGGGNWNNGTANTANWYSAFAIGLAPPGTGPGQPGPQVGRQLPNMPSYQVFAAGPAGRGHSI